MRREQPKVGDIVISDDSGLGYTSCFVIGVIAEIDRKEAFNSVYRVEWADADTNPDANEWFEIKELKEFINTYESYMKGLYE